MVLSHTDAEIKEAERDCTRPGKSPVNKTSDAIEILNRTFGSDPERRRAIDKEREQLEEADWMDASLGPYKPEPCESDSKFTPQQIDEDCKK